MEKIYIGQILELEKKHLACIHLFGFPSLVVLKESLGNCQFGEFIICQIKTECHKKVVKKLYTFKESQIGEIIFENGEPKLQFFYRKGKLVQLDCKYFSNLFDGAKVRFRLETAENEVKAKIYQILGEKDDIGIDIIALAEQNGIPTIFSKTAIRQANHIKEPMYDSVDSFRKDLSSHQIFTIDGIHSKDFDDAVSLKEENNDYILGVHIADVGRYIKEGSPLDLEARKRGMTAYLLNYVFPMFPEVISNGVCSLNELVDRYTLTCEMKITKEGIIKEVNCFPTMIHSKKRMTYESVNELLDGNRVDGYYSFHETLQEMSLLADKLYQQRMKNGSIDFDGAEPIIRLDQFGHVTDVKARVRGKAELLIQEFMLAANRSIASLLKQENIMYPHRIHETPDMKRLTSVQTKLASIGIDISPLFEANNQSFVMNQILNQYRESPNYMVISNLLISAMRRAKYSIEDLGHFGLGLERNLHFTSPIRRYPDLACHRLIREHYFLNEPQTLTHIERLEDMIEKTNHSEKRIDRTERRMIELKSKEYLLNHVGETMEAIIQDCNHRGILITLKDCIEGFISKSDLENGSYQRDDCAYTFLNSSVVYKLGTRLKVKLIKDSSVDGNVIFKIISPNNSKTYSLGNYRKFY